MGKIIKALEKAAKERVGSFDKKPNEPAQESINEFQLSQPSETQTMVVDRIPDIHGSEIKESDEAVINPVKESGLDKRIISYFDPKSVVSEQYKILATNLLALNRGNHPQTISITSSIAGEGKTLTAINLGVTLARAVHNPRIILVDADMRKGQFLKYLGLPKERKGLSDYLRAQASIEDIIFTHRDLEQLNFISCGPTPANPAELLASGRMRQLLLALRAQYDIVLIDTPPVIPVTDAVIVGSNVEGVLMVIGAGRTQRGMVSRASELLLQTNANIIGYTLTSIQYFVPDYIYKYL